ncbi:hypothetical protein F5Y18DRAFT_436903 [Xylariaceae sp. FL1019]|nr:hypothetical protein F5Y18DRAFT_436903 [Xylariaceae sp. FL1019]
MSSLASSYRIYKQDTDAVAAWLASTAKSLGYTLKSTTDATSSTGRLKGKARKEAKQAKLVGPKYIISIDDFVRLAEYIANKRAPVPETLMVIVDRVIEMRSGFGAKLAEYGKIVNEEAENNHQYFIEVLEIVRDTLKPLMKANKASAAQQSSKKSSMNSKNGGASGASQTGAKDNDLSNRFANLTVEHPSQDFIDSPDIERPVKCQNDDATYEAETETGLDHALLMLFMLIHDMNYIRSVLKLVWAEYKAGRRELVAAALTTSTAVDLVRNMVKDFEPVIEQHNGLGRLLHAVHTTQCCYYGNWDIADMTVERQSGIPGCPPDLPIDKQDLLNYNTHDEGTYYVVWKILGALMNTVRPARIPFFAQWVYGYWDEKSDRSAKTGVQKATDDQSLLWQYFTEVMIATRGLKGYPVKDELFRGMEQMAEAQKVPFYAAFAAQVYLDIAYLLGPDIERPWRTLIQQLTYMENEIRLLIEFNEKMKLKPWCKSNAELLLVLQRHIIDIMHGDTLREWLESLHNEAGVPQEDTTKTTQRMLRISPVMAGLWLFHFRARFEAAGRVVADTWGGLQYCTHLYKALSHEKLLSDEWADMEFAYAALRAESFFVGGQAPTNPIDYMKAVWLQGGMSIRSLQFFSDRSGPIPSKAGPRCLKPITPVLSTFVDRYGHHTEQTSLSPEYVSQIIELSTYEKDKEGVVNAITDPKKLQAKKAKLLLMKKGEKKSVKGGAIHIRDLIFPLLDALHAEAREHTLPYMHMHRQCFSVLAGIRDKCGKVLYSQTQNPKFFDDKSKLPFVPFYVFLTTLQGDRRLMLMAAEFFNDEVIMKDDSHRICDEIWDVERAMPRPHYNEEIEEGRKKQEDGEETDEEEPKVAEGDETEGAE